MATKKEPLSLIKKIQLQDDVILGEIVEREAPSERDLNTAQIIQPILNDAQLSIVLNKTPEWAIKKRQGGGGKVYTYVPHGYVTDTLNKAFGFDWDLILDPMSDGKMYVLEIEDVIDRNGKLLKQNRHIAVCGHLAVRIHDKEGKIVSTVTKSGFGSQLWLPTMELGDALKAARSDLLKTCAFQFGIALDLYWNERAEVSEFENAQRIQVERIEKAKELLVLEKRGIPTNFGDLLTKANTEYQINGDIVEEIASDTLDAIMDYAPEQIVLLWDKVIAHTSRGKSEDG